MTVNFLGEPHEIVITHDGGYEPDTNAHAVDWEWCDPAMNSIDLTAEQEQGIYDQIYKVLYE
jgi:hypothetical protein